MTALLIVNPFASGVDEHRLAAVQASLPGGTETRLTTAPGEATQIAREAGDATAIYVLGGDGTYNEVLNGVEADVPLGFLPGGGTSVLPRALGLPRNPVKAAQQVSRGTTRRIGLGRVNGRRFGFNAGLGFDAELVRKVDQIGRTPEGRRPGEVAFMRVAASVLWARNAHIQGLSPGRLGRVGLNLIARQLCARTVCAMRARSSGVPMDHWLA